MSPIPGCVPTKPGQLHSLPGMTCILDENGNKITEPNVTGFLVMTQSWPGQMRTVMGSSTFQRYLFFSSSWKLFYGDGAFVDEDGYYWITGRVDDV
ncbi:MAG: hypothetical protein CM1200mP1_00010 [Candidatus Neomarinimicrobiota bacterium]|nr:MAG: hypothetical protein CM1200mP1_00010 [Candidatus Neomarinimicrobiota bacterium]